MGTKRNRWPDTWNNARTRSQKALARKRLSQLAANTLSTEMLIKILSYLNDDQEPLNATLASCCLVCRPWVATGQYVLFQNITLREATTIKKFHRSLMRSSILGLNVRSLNISLSPFPLLRENNALALARMVSECLERTRDLASLGFNKTASRHLLRTRVVRSFCTLPKLKVLKIEQHYARWAAEVGQSSFEVDLLNNLPQCIEKLAILKPLDDLFDALPNICERLYQPPLTRTPPSPSHQNNHAAQMPGSSRDAGSRIIDQIGSRSLSLHLEQHEPRLSTFFASLSTSISSKISKISFVISPVIREAHICQPLVSLIEAIPLLEELELGLISLRGNLFDSMPPLSRLRALKILTRRALYDENWVHFCEALSKFIRHSPLLQRFDLRADLRDLSLDPLVDGVIISTIRAGTVSTLHSFSVGNFDLPNRIPTRQNCIEEFDHQNLVPPSIETFERLCESAPSLKHLEIAVPLDELPRVSASIAQLSRLCSARLHNYPLTRPLGGEDLNFDLFFETCNYLKQMLEQEA